MGSQRLSGKISSLSISVLGQPLQGERRLQKRHGSEDVVLTFLGVDHPVLNWSPEGFLVADRHPDLAIGSIVSGVLSVRGYNGRFRFSARLLRRDARTKEIAFTFANSSRALRDALARIAERP
jgi:hypothetical protein